MIEIINSEEDKISFITDMSPTLANAIRRSSLEIPILAIDEVEFIKNDSALYDEIIAHRLGLTPLKTEKLNEIEKCICKGKGCSKCTSSFKLSAKGPGTVYSDGLKPKSSVLYKMPLTLLEENQEIEFVAKARVGRAVDHSKYSPGLVFYRDYAEIKINGGDEEIAKACPTHAIELTEGKLRISDLNKCDLCMACVEVSKKSGGDSIEVKPSGKLIFFIESWKQISAKEILEESINSLNKNLKELSKQMK